MNNWKTTLISFREYPGTVNGRRGIFQGDSPSPLLFVLCMVPLTLILRGVNARYGSKGRTTRINHFLSWMI